MLSSKIVLLALTSFALAAPLQRRQVPQEHSHRPTLLALQKSIQLNNPESFVDPVFGLLGNAAAAQGLGNTKDANCLQQAMADRAFTNAKEAGDVDGQVQALIYRALERNSLSVGGTTDKCTSVQAVNPEIAAIQQHQDAASPGADAINKAIELELAKQIASVGGDPLLALNSGTFAPGQTNDPTAKGNSCNDDKDDNGCIFTLNLLRPAATEDEIRAAVGGDAGTGNGAGNDNGNGGNDNGNNNGNGNATTTLPPCEVTVTVTVAPTATASLDPTATCPPPVTVTVTAGATATASATATESAATPTETAGAGAGAGGSDAGNGNLQTFTGSLGGQAAPAVTAGGRGFLVEGSDSFVGVGAALNRSCDIQHNKCANAANSGGDFTVGQCDQQNNDCKAATKA
ncbi:hypothetical protein AAF712_008368 [Marasmius tenuissimus]|uniref:Uncharacterized protein n=1 Tax=Marasmius tenuissimus TaxID=585030 RepID=A0ABR2ZTS6_9AGAR|nr:hypothetical protein PM082_017497 [Marasmius tenuissimus]